MREVVVILIVIISIAQCLLVYDWIDVKKFEERLRDSVLDSIDSIGDSVLN